VKLNVSSGKLSRRRVLKTKVLYKNESVSGCDILYMLFQEE